MNTTALTQGLRMSQLEMAESFKATARVWRKVADRAARENDYRAVRFAHKYALENEQWAREAELTAETL